MVSQKNWTNLLGALTVNLRHLHLFSYQIKKWWSKCRHGSHHNQILDQACCKQFWVHATEELFNNLIQGIKTEVQSTVKGRTNKSLLMMLLCRTTHIRSSKSTPLQSRHPMTCKVCSRSWSLFLCFEILTNDFHSQINLLSFECNHQISHLWQYMLAFIDESLLKFSWSFPSYIRIKLLLIGFSMSSGGMGAKVFKVWSFFQTVMYVLHHLSMLLFCWIVSFWHRMARDDHH